MPNGFDINAARQAGYSDDEILSHLTQTRNFDVQGALKSGYGKADLINYLASTPGASQGPSLEAQALANPPRPTFNIPNRPLEMVGAGVGDEAQGNAQMADRYMQAGPAEIGGGIKDVAQGNVARGLHRTIKGAGVTAIPVTASVAPFAAASAPVPFFLSALMGTGGGIAAQKGAQMLGASPDQADLAGDIGGLAGAYGGYKLGNSGANNFLASKMRYPATARQSQIGRPGTIKGPLPSFLQKYLVPDWAVPTGDVGTSTNPGWFSDLPARMPDTPEPIDPVAQAVKARTAAWIPTRMPPPEEPPDPVDPVAQAVKARTAAWLPTRIKPAVAPEPQPQSPFQGMMSTSPQSVSSLPPVSIRPEAETPAQPNVQFVPKFSSQKNMIQDPNSPAPLVRTTFQSYPRETLVNMIQSPETPYQSRIAALAELRRNPAGIDVDSIPGVKYLAEPGAGRLPWRNYKR